ncbi:MAG: hypothetical protein KDB07_13395, partial [Planctomycetes bacterium]|nr:hypothetical protein [Planctomycetota bacterium]
MKRKTLTLSVFGFGAALCASLALLTSTPLAQEIDRPTVDTGAEGDDGSAVRKQMTIGEAIR